MITIDQLLESVDLDFEPRFVTKDPNGMVWLWETKPVPLKNGWGYSSIPSHTVGFIKLAEFADKDWQECIYEVPRKITGKIERFTLEDFACVFDTENYHRNVLDSRAFNKLNTLVDAVNKHADIIHQIGQWGSSKGEFLWCETLKKFEPDELKGAK